MFKMGDISFRVKKDVDEAVRLYRLAAAAGNAKAGFALAEIYTQPGKYMDISRAVEIAEHEADRGKFLGFVMMAGFLGRGIGVPADPARAKEFDEKLRRSEFDRDQYKFAVRLEDGKGCAQDPVRALRFYEMAAENGHELAMYNLGVHFASEAIPPDLAKAAYWYKRSADRGCDNAAWAYGACLEKGEGVKPDLTIAVEYYQKAALMGYGKAFTALGRICERGNNHTEAAGWYEKAAEADDKIGSYYLACLYYAGKGRVKNREKAIEFFKKARDLGLPQANKRLVELGAA
jgi:TPR repeat protein